MHLLIHKPYLILWLAMPLIWVLTIVSGAGDIELQLHDNYLVIGRLLVGGLFAFFFFALGFGYWVFRNYSLIPRLTIIHVIGTILLTSAFFVLLLWSDGAGYNLVSDLYTDSNYHLSVKGHLVLAAIFGWVACQVLFIINILIGLVRGL